MANVDDELQIPLTSQRRRRSEGSSSFLKACFNATNAFLGIGLLTIPYALKSGGWLSLSLFLLVSILGFYSSILLKTCLDSDQSINSYLDISERAFGKPGRLLVTIVMNSELYLAAIGYLILEGDNLHTLFPHFAINTGKLICLDGKQSFVIITALVILPSMLLTDLGILSYVSATGFFSCLAILFSVVYVGVVDGVGFQQRGTMWNFTGIPTAISLYIVCYAGHPVVPSIYISVRNVGQFTKVLLCSFVVTTLTYLSIAVVAYLMYGTNTESEFTLNLPKDKVGAQVAIYITLLIPVTRYALILTPVANGIESRLSEDYRNRRLVRSLIRVALLVSTVVLACMFPYYELLMTIVGSIFFVLSSFLFPCLFYLKMFDTYRKWSFKLVGIVGILVFGTVSGILGTYSSIGQFLQQ